MKFLWIIVAFEALSLTCAAQQRIDYVRQIKPVLQARCYACHGVLKQEAGLRVDTVGLAMKGGEHGATIRPGESMLSLLVKRIAAHDESERMPPEGEPLTQIEIEAIKNWIDQGATAPADEPPERDPRDHWAFRTPVRIPLPEIPHPEWAKTPIDTWIAAAQQPRGIVAQIPADKRVWLRRVYLDLIGLPPTLRELDEFVADNSADAHDKVVTRLLESPLYGERWGRHWMDIWRYSDWWGLGAEVRNSQKHMWHWRDWIIESLNADKGYDQMLREMLAADELYPNDLDKLRAGGFLARQYFKFNRTSWLDETIEHTSKAMLGLTMNCAKCHDHKYDPFTQADYYNYRAIFEPYQIRMDLLPGEVDLEKNGLPRPFDCHIDAQTFIHIRGDDRNPDKSRVIGPAVPAMLINPSWHVEPVALPPEAVHPGLRPFVAADLLKQAQDRVSEATAAVRSAEKKLAEAIATEIQASKNRTADAAVDALSAIPRQLVVEDFAVERAERWERRGGSWVYSEGRLKQSQAGGARAALRWKQPIPLDFEARFKYVATGGDQWKSVGIAFDVSDRGHEVLAYLSSFAGGPKSQIAYKNGGDHVYPPEAMQGRTLELNKPHELLLRVRGTTVNLTVDGQHSLAYRLPIPRQAGHLELITFDATVEFLAFELNELLPTTSLIEPAFPADKSTDSIPREQAVLAVDIARKAHLATELLIPSIHARLAADRARWQEPIPENQSQLISAAVRAERIHSAAKADEEVSRAELNALKASSDKQAEAMKKLADSKAALDAARKAIDVPAETYAPLVGSIKTLESNLETEDSRRKPFPATSSGRRSAFARWLTDPRHPLTARVAVNHIWLRHMGRPLVPTVFDFGRKGLAPTHPELLDWLAVELLESGWSMKHIHRLIVLSNTYRLSSSNGDAPTVSLTADPENKLYWRSNPVRMEAQVVRDSLLFLAGELDLTRGGPSIPVTDDSSKRRSLYYVHSHNEHQKFLSMFDDAGVLECYRRAESIVPQQALALENSPLATTMAQKIATRIAAANPNLSETEFIRSAFLTVLSVEPSEREVATVLEAMAQWSDAKQKSNRADAATFARTSVIHALLNHNDFVTVR